MDEAAKGAAALTADQPQQALIHYTKALIEHPESPDYFTQRAVALGRLKPPRHDLALQDAEYAVTLAKKRERRDKIQAAQQRRVVALYGLGRFADAKLVLDTTRKWRKSENKKDIMEYDMWNAKIERQIKTTNSESASTQEFPQVQLLSQKDLKALLQAQIQDGDFNFNPNSSVASEEKVNADKARQEVEPSTATSMPSHPKVAQKIRHDFYQNNDNLIVTFYAKKVDPARFSCRLEPTSVALQFPHPDDNSSTYSYTIDPTYAPIDVGQSKSKVFGTKIEVTLSKQEKGLKWASLQSTGDAPPPARTLPTPYASTKPAKDWEKTAAELTKKEKPKKKAKNNKTKDGHDDHGGGNDTASNDEDGGVSDLDSDDDGGDAVDGFFKKLYKGADDDQRRAMMKSFYESNGTALSTNWSEVGKGKVEEVKGKDD